MLFGLTDASRGLPATLKLSSVFAGDNAEGFKGVCVGRDRHYPLLVANKYSYTHIIVPHS